MKVALYSLANQGRAGHIAQAMKIGASRHGVQAEIFTRWNGKPAGDVAIAYGWKHEPVFTAYKAAGAHYAYFDMGYFNRRPAGDKGGSREGHHRLAIDDWDTSINMARDCPTDRWKALGIEVLPGRPPHANHILVAGMSAKAAGTHGFTGGQWERETRAHLETVWPSRAVIYRDKPRDLGAVEPIETVLARTKLIITHHSNVAVDGLVAGVPCWAKKGIGRLASYADLDHAISLTGPQLTVEVRVKLLADVAYAQWTPEEMRSGAAWDHIKGLIK